MSRSRPVIVALVVPVLAPLLAGLALSGCTWKSKLGSLDVPRPAAASYILAADGSVLAKLDAGEYRDPVKLADVAPVARDAVVAIEDHRFYDHAGVDLIAIARAAQADIEAGKPVEGGSTITQQYIRAVLLDNRKTARRKLAEIALALDLERSTTKDEILERYLNEVYFGNGAYGIGAAAKRYFSTSAADLDLAQAAMLAGLLKAPEGLNPYERPVAARARRDVVLDAMVRYGFADAAAVERARREPLRLVDRSWSHAVVAPYFVEHVKALILDDERFGSTRAQRRRLLFSGGLRIHTTLDRTRQALAEQSVATVLNEPDRDPSASVVSIDPRTGHVVAYVGGRDFFGAEPYAKFDLAGQARRQAGSAFKPFVLAAAIEAGIPLDREYDAPNDIELAVAGQQPWKVHNYEPLNATRLNLVDATVQSANTVYAQLVEDVGPARVAELAKRVGIDAPISDVPSVALGVDGVSALQMADAYATFAADGVGGAPVFISSVTGPKGRVIVSERTERRRLVEPELARTVNHVLQQVVSRGTGINARIGRPVAGKTGTGEEWRDAWFVGSTPELTTAVWIGFPEAQRSMQPPATRELVTGGSWPAQIWAWYSAAALVDTPAGAFPAPTPGGAIRTAPLAYVVGFGEPDARRVVERAGYSVTTVPVPSDDDPPNVVIGQTPEAGTAIPAGAAVTLLVSSGPPPILTPEFLGLTEDAARDRAATAGIDIDVVTATEPPPGNADRAGRVWQQQPISNQPLTRGTKATVWINP